MITRKITRAIAGACTLAAAATASAFTVNANGKIVWNYHAAAASGVNSGATTAFPFLAGGGIDAANYPIYSSSFATTPPLTAPANLDSLTSSIAFMLPESRDIRQSTTVSLSSDDQTNLRIAAGQQIDVWVTFMSEGAGFENSVGYFTYDPSNPPTRTSASGLNSLTTDQIIFPRVSQPVPLPPASSTGGTTVYLGRFGGSSETGLGFFIAANGWSGTGRGGLPGVKDSQDRNWIFYSLKGLNPETSAGNLNQHTVLVQDRVLTGTDGRQYQRLILGIEDYKRDESACDHDFNDVVLALHAAPVGNVPVTQVITNLTSTPAIPTLAASTDPDTDGDGVKDSVDEFPKDFNRAFSSWYPGTSSYGTLVFEDQWPNLGDYDLNDVVIRYRSRQILTSLHRVKELQMDLELAARGGLFSNGLALGLPGVPASNISSVSLTRNGQPVAGARVAPDAVAANGGAVIEIFQDATVEMPADNACAADTRFRNTVAGCPVNPNVVYALKVVFAEPILPASFPAAPYDPFIFNSESGDLGFLTSPMSAKGREVHLPGRQPTSRADMRLFGRGNDASVAPSGASTVWSNSYKTGTGLPWALDIPTGWDYPPERLDTIDAYPNVVPWANSGGVNKPNWYATPASPSLTFRNGR